MEEIKILGRADETAASFVVTARLPLGARSFQISVYEDPRSKAQHVALLLGHIGDSAPGPVLVRVHSECMTGDVFGSTRCDCGAQLNEALDLITCRGRGALIYLRQEGRGIGLVEKLHAYNLQDGRGLDTVDANLALGHAADQRTFEAAAEMLAELRVRDVELLTNNPRKVADLRSGGVNVVRVIRSAPVVTEHNVGYLRTKRNRLGHLIPDFDRAGVDPASEPDPIYRKP